MLRSTYKVAVWAAIGTICIAQEGLFGGLWPLALQGQQGPLDQMFPLPSYSLWPYGSSGQYGESGILGGFRPYGYTPFGMLGAMGSAGQTGEAAGTEAASTEAATEPGEGPATQQPTLFDLNMMMMWNQLLGNQMSAQVPNNQGTKPLDDGTQSSQESAIATPASDTKSSENRAGRPAVSGFYSDMSLLPYLFMQQ